MFSFCPVITGLFIVKTGLYPLFGKITVNDDSSDKNSNGIGLGNVQNRLKLYYNKDNLFSIDSEGENKGTQVTIRIPVEEEPYV